MLFKRLMRSFVPENGGRLSVNQELERNAGVQEGKDSFACLVCDK
jgi:hypothetical protein